VVAGDLHEVVGTRVRLARLAVPREHLVEERCQHRGRIGGSDERERVAADQVPGGVSQQQVDERSDEDAAEDRPERVGEGLVRLRQAGDEDAEADADHQHPRAILRTPRPADQAGEDE
jgi:hypothetical protein